MDEHGEFYVRLRVVERMLNYKLSQLGNYEDQLLKDRENLQEQIETIDKKIELVERISDSLRLSMEDVAEFDEELEKIL